MEKIERLKINDSSVYFFNIDDSIIIMKKKENGSFVMQFFGNINKDDPDVKKIIITRENYEVYMYFNNLYYDFLLHNSLNKQVDILFNKFKYPVYYQDYSFDSTSFSMQEHDDEIHIILSNENLKDKKDFTVVFDECCLPVVNMYKSMENNFNLNHQIDIEEILYKEKTRKKEM